MKLFLLSAFAASAAAFAPASQTKGSSALAADFSKEIGSQAPLGYYDPFMFTTGESQETFDHLREVEIKHGRISMLAVVGYLVTIAGIRFPGAEAIPAGFKAFPALMETADGQNVLGQMVLFVFLAEQCNRDVAGVSAFPGDYRNGFLDFGWDKLSAETQTKKRAIELNNGRAAQMGILGLMVHEQMGVSILPGNILP